MAASSILESSLVVVGPGRAGGGLVRSWKRAGGSLVEVVARDAMSARKAADALRVAAVSLDEIRSRSDLLVLAVPDDRIGSVATELSSRVRCRIAFHLSGALPAEVLAPLRAGGAGIASLHPLRAFSGATSDTWEGTLVVIEGDPEAAEAGERISQALGASARRIAAASKPLYHAAAALAAGGTMALLSLAVRAATAAGLSEPEARSALARLASESAAATADRPFADAFAGPISRRDVATVRAHEAATTDLAEFRRLYRLLAEEILRATPGRGREEEIRALLAEMNDGRSG